MEEGILRNVIDKIVCNPTMADNAAIFNLDKLSSESIVAQAAQVLMCCNATMMTRAAKRGRSENDEQEGGTHAASVPSRSTLTPLQSAIAKEWTL